MGEQGVQESPLRGPLVESQRGGCVVTYPYHLGGRPVRKSGIHLQREVFSPRVLSLVMSLKGTMVLNAELSMRDHSFHLDSPGQSMSWKRPSVPNVLYTQCIMSLFSHDSEKHRILQLLGSC